jgi:hypothetical protein
MNDHIVGGWTQLIPSRGRGQVGQTVRLSAPPPPANEEWRRPRKYSGTPTRVVGLRSESSIDGWDLQPKEMRIFPAELAKELVARGAVRYASVEEIAKAEI